MVRHCWNLISGISEPVNEYQIIDPYDIVIDNTLYTYNGVYLPTEIIEPGRGYWIRSNSPGQVSIKSDVSIQQEDIFVDRTENAHCLKFKNALDKQCNLYFGINLDEDEIVHYTLPPIPDFVGGLFDVRFTQDKKLTNGNDILTIINDAWPLTVSWDDDLSNEDVQWLIEILDDLGRTSGVDQSTFQTYVLNSTSKITFQTPIERIRLSKKTVSEIPNSFSLHPNYPNPFNPTTTLRYDIPTDSKVQLIIYDILGREVVTLLKEIKPAGFQQTVWEGKDNLGNSVSSGVYIYCISAGSFQSTQKMVLLR
jgi:hypothetical protein|tara:strand:- start:15757 stop:16683 length:927 start_codon:yes stop_codon:yes gene_type:complete